MRHLSLLAVLLFALCAGCGEDTVTVDDFLAGWAEPVGDDIDAATGFPSRIRRLKDGAEMVLVPAGTFLMGAVAGDAKGKGVEDEHPRHEVTLTKGYYLDVHEVTNAQFEAFADATYYATTPEVVGFALVFSPEDSMRMDAWDMDAWDETPGASWRLPWTGATKPDDWEDHPVVLVSWDDAKAFCDWVGAALPTEAQFERALRGGVDGAIYPWGDDMPPAPPVRGNFQDASFRDRVGPRATGALHPYQDGHVGTAPVGRYAPNAYGLQDLSGNVWEWCLDPFDAAYYEASPREDPLKAETPEGSQIRVRRGGGWMTGSGGRLRCSWRGLADRDVCRDYMGFRCAKTLP